MGLFDSGSGGLFGGDIGGGLYGSMLEPAQRQALAYRGLLAAAGAFGQAAMPSRMPIPIGAALGQAAGAMGEAQDTAAMNALRANLLGLQGQQLKANLGLMSSQMSAYGNLFNNQNKGLQQTQTAEQPLAQPAAEEPALANEDQTTTRETPPNLSDPLDLIEHYESGGRNIMQRVMGPGGGFNPSTGTLTGPSTAQGFYQITNSTWRDTAPKAGIDLGQYPTAMSAPKEVQRKVAQTLFDEQGFAPWAPYNPRLAAAINTMRSNPAAGLRFAGGSSGDDGSQPSTLADAEAKVAALQPSPVSAFNDAARARLAQNGPVTSLPQLNGVGGPPAMVPAGVAPQAPAPMSMAPAMPLGINPDAARQIAAIDAIRGGKTPEFINRASVFPFVGPEATAKSTAEKNVELQFAPKLAPYQDPFFRATIAAQLFPPGSPERGLAEMRMAEAAGVKPFTGGNRAGFPGRKFNLNTGNYDIAFQNPTLGQGGILNPDGSVSVAQGAPEAAQTMATAQAAGPAAFKREDIGGPYGQVFTTTALNLPNIMTGAAGPAASPLSGQPMPASPAAAAPLVPGGALAPAGPQRPEAVSATFPVQLPGGATKDLSSLTVSDLFPNGQGIPQPPKPPPGATYGPASSGVAELQKKDADRVEQYGKEAAENQKGYQDLGHLREILDRGIRTSNIAPLWRDIGNLAQGLGVPIKTPVDVNDAAAFDKATTDLTYAAVKKMGGRVLVSEIEGLQKANPNLVIPRAANYSLLNDILSYSKWQDVRAKLSQDFLTETGGAPLSAFESRFATVAPLDAVTQHYKGIFRNLGATFPGDNTPARAYAIGPDGHMIYRENGALFDAATGQPFTPGRR